jgi:type I restriction enzyme, R subunit
MATYRQETSIINELEEKGIFFEELTKYNSNKDLDPFDLICHIAFDRPALTRRERVNNVKKRDIFAKYGEEAKAII